LSTAPRPHPADYARLMRAAAELCRPESLDALAPRTRARHAIGNAAVTRDVVRAIDAIAGTEHIAYDFISRGGKHLRPFIAMAAYDAMTGGRASAAGFTDDNAGDGDNAGDLDRMPRAVRRAALSIEVFHKASLIHDDIEDDDAFRYGQSAVHRRFGSPIAINVGDYLIGLGYRLLSRLDPDDTDDGIDDAARLDVLDSSAAAHMRLAEGQGAELLWRDNGDRRLSPQDALKIYALKTSPGFEAALYSGVRLAGDASDYVEPIRKFSRSLGVAFQILNDVGDFAFDEDNKRSVGGDILKGSPTLLLALALEALSPPDQQRLVETAGDRDGRSAAQRLAEVDRLYHQADVFAAAMRLVDQHRTRALQVADQIEPQPLRRLLCFLVDTVLERPDTPALPVVRMGTVPVTNSDEVSTS